MGISPRGAAIYRMRITSLHFVVLHKFFVDSACKQLTTASVASSQARNLLRPNKLSDDITDDFVNNFISFFE